MIAVATSFDADRGVVRAAVDIDAPRERVFAALTDPRELVQWWGRDDMYTTEDWQVDLRPGGAWRCTPVAPGAPPMSVRGEYRTVEPPRLLEFTWLASWDGDVPTTVRVELDPLDGGTRTRLTLLHSGLTTRDMGSGTTDGWNRVLSWLEEHVR
jgi:uncharacterized protein YndB with AHSA1/START domain